MSINGRNTRAAPLQTTEAERASETGSSGSTKKSEEHLSEEEADTCLICAEPIVVAAICPCNHTTCHLCAYRQRKLYGKTQCLICRTESTTVIFTDEYIDREYDDIPTTGRIQGDTGILYTSKFAQRETVKLLEYTCPINSCSSHSTPFRNFKQLNEHAQSVHSKFYCVTCGNAKKYFPCEMKMYTQNKLRLHMRKGDYDGFEGHPSCTFCDNKYFYSEDELNRHRRDVHERCDVCYRMDSSNSQYFKNVEQLAKHFQSAHYSCKVPSCVAQKVIVFGELIELEAHMAKEHPLLTTGKLSFGHQLTPSSNSTTNDKKQLKEQQQNSMETKKKRFETRAKHYLSHDSSLFDKFVLANDNFTKGTLSARELQYHYSNIFGNGTNVDIPILLFEFSELFPANSTQRNALVDINKYDMNEKKFEEAFPSLPAQGKKSVPLLLNSRNIKVVKRPGTSFPSLPTSSPSISSVNSSWGAESNVKKPIARGIPTNTPSNGHSIPGYAPVATTNPKKQSNPMSYNMISASSSSSSPSYSAGNPYKTVNSRSLSSLDLSKASWGSAPAPGSVSSNRKNDPSLFPSLQKPKQKVKIIPRVNPVNNSNGLWGNASLDSPTAGSSGDALSDLLDTGLNIKIKSGRRKKK